MSLASGMNTMHLTEEQFDPDFNTWLLEIAMTNLSLNVEPKGLGLSIENIMNQGMMILALNFPERAEERLKWNGAREIS